jgi:hypothetical protein
MDGKVTPVGTVGQTGVSIAVGKNGVASFQS